ncbi:unnamed protein product [Pieris macdunnoughi]|uniref:Uncharacterized protein n=1 Tax=Pieris macdunnoughi TaxID=345717 RepID=A0A821MX77_9NEOP|nr:unnamed protein product [Pieris macdunnoughi]
MENIYDDLENYEEANIIEDLKNENSELKKKLEQYTSTINQLQVNIFQDFENLSSEYKKLELNYSSLLKTARAEIERKTNMITQLNVEKDMMVIQTFQNKGRQCFKKVTCNKETISKNTEIDSSRYKTEDIHCKMVGKRKSGHMMDIKENVLDSKEKPSSKNIPNFRKSTPSQFKNRCDEEHSHLPKEQRLRDDEDMKSSKIKNSNSIEGRQLYHNASVSMRSDSDRHSDNLYRQREKARYRRNSPQRISRHRSRSPPADRFSRHKSHDRRKHYNDSEHSAHRDIIPVDQIEQPVLKHKLLPHSEEPSQKKIRVDSYGTYASSERSCGDSELISFGAALTTPEDPLGSCQSPDYLHCDGDHSSIKEIIHTATTPQADPRITSKKYIVRAENGKEVLKSKSSSEIYLQRVNPSLWGIPKKSPKKPPQYSTNNADFPSLLTNACKPTHESQPDTSKSEMSFINDTEPHPFVGIETVEGDLLLSDEEEIDSKIPVDQENHFENLPKTKDREETDIPPKDSVKSLQKENNRNAAISLENNRAEKSLSNKETSKLGKNTTCNVELDQVSDKSISVNNVKIHKNSLDLPAQLKCERGSEDSTDTSTKLEKPKKYQEPKRRQCPEKSDKHSKVNISNKKHKKKKLDETKVKEIDKSTLAPDGQKKFSLFGECSNSLIMPEDLGIRSVEVAESLKIKFASICNDSQNAVDHVENDPNPGPSLIQESIADTSVDVNMTASEQLTNGTVICSDTQIPEKANLFENIKPAISTDSPDVVIVSTGVQSKLLEDDIDRDISKSVSIETALPLTALATSTPLKEQNCFAAGRSVKDTVRDEAGDVPDVRIFVKRRRKIKKL